MIFFGFEMNACPPGPFRGAFGFVPDGFLVIIPKHEKVLQSRHGILKKA